MSALIESKKAAVKTALDLGMAYKPLVQQSVVDLQKLTEAAAMMRFTTRALETSITTKTLYEPLNKNRDEWKELGNQMKLMMPKLEEARSELQRVIDQASSTTEDCKLSAEQKQQLSSLNLFLDLINAYITLTKKEQLDAYGFVQSFQTLPSLDSKDRINVTSSSLFNHDHALQGQMNQAVAKYNVFLTTISRYIKLTATATMINRLFTQVIAKEENQEQYTSQLKTMVTLSQQLQHLEGQATASRTVLDSEFKTLSAALAGKITLPEEARNQATALVHDMQKTAEALHHRISLHLQKHNPSLHRSIQELEQAKGSSKEQTVGEWVMSFMTSNNSPQKGSMPSPQTTEFNSDELDPCDIDAIEAQLSGIINQIVPTDQTTEEDNLVRGAPHLTHITNYTAGGEEAEDSLSSTVAVGLDSLTQAPQGSTNTTFTSDSQTPAAAVGLGLLTQAPQGSTNITVTSVTGGISTIASQLEGTHLNPLDLDKERKDSLCAYVSFIMRVIEQYLKDDSWHGLKQQIINIFGNSFKKPSVKEQFSASITDEIIKTALDKKNKELTEFLRIRLQHLCGERLEFFLDSCKGVNLVLSRENFEQASTLITLLAQVTGQDEATINDISQQGRLAMIAKQAISSASPDAVLFGFAAVAFLLQDKKSNTL